MDLIFTPFELVLNQILHQDPKYAKFLEKYNSKIILINSVYIYIKKSGLSFSLSISKPSQQPDLVIKFLYTQSIILLIETFQDNIDHQKLDLNGDLGLAQDFFTIFKNYDSFYLNKIAKIFGDIFSYSADFVGKDITNSLKYKQENLKDMFVFYLEDELQVIATKEEVKSFISDIDKIRLECDRLEARINKLMQN